MVFRRTDRRRALATNAVVILGWSLAVLALAWRHVFWSDEVRALTMATQGDSVVAMLQRLRGDGHPALWYLMLRGAYALVGAAWVLPATAFAVALATTVLVVVRSPFAWPLVILFLAGRIGLYEYAVMARNYGISALCMFAFAASYARHRDRGIVLGMLLFLLANCNVHSAILVVAYLVFWGLDLPPEDRAARRTFVRNALVASLGIAVCAVTVYPPFNDAAPLALAPFDALVAVAKAVVLPGIFFKDIAGADAWRAVVGSPGFAADVAMSALLFAGTLGLVRRRAAWLAALVALVSLAAFFAVVYGGSYRHEALWMVFLVSLYWIVGDDRRGGFVQRLGRGAFVALLGVQLIAGLGLVVPIVAGNATESRSRDAARLIAADPRLVDAVVMADPDDLVEALPYYVRNPLYLPREQRFGDYAVFTRDAQLVLDLDDLLAIARRVRDESGRPVVVLLAERLERDRPPRDVHENYNWTLSITPDGTARFLDATERLARFGPVCCSPESFDVYLLDRQRDPR
jgi:hypothetical protein